MGDADLLLGQEEALDALLAAVKVFSRRSRLPQADVGDADHLLGQEEAVDALLAAVKVFSRRSRLPQADGVMLTISSARRKLLTHVRTFGHGKSLFSAHTSSSGRCG